ncbi:MAG: SusC/RagA family TonB-linked outer membrane protein [Alistipes sp.]|nr:SusC/RagA family TonB-linked outer membrane protein [Alistipes sp.]
MRISTQRVFSTILVALLALLTMVTPAHAESQNIRRQITISAKDMPMRTFLEAIEKQCNHTFFYSNSVLNDAPNVTLDATAMPLEELLHKVFDGTSRTFEVVGDKIAIKFASSTQVAEGGGITSSQPAAATPSKQQLVSGTVIDQSGKPMAGVAVYIASTLQGVVTGIDGKYEIKASPEQELQFSFLGCKTETVKVGTRTVIDISMIEESQAVEQVIVTALGIKRDEKSLGYAAQKVGGDILSSATNANNWLSGLTGQVAGLNIQQSNSGPGGTTRVTLRGESSVDFSNNTALFVVDGVPMHNHSTQSDAGGEGSVYAIDYGDGTGDINPEDIENVTILKGPAATALYGSAAANGAIVITTKSANKLESKISVTYSTNLTFESVNTSPDLQYEYGQGDNPDYYYFVYDADKQKGVGLNPYPTYTSSSSLLSWGAKMDGSPAYQYYNVAKGIGGVTDALGDFRRTESPFVSHGDWFKDFFETGHTWSNSVSVSGRINKRNSVRISVRDFRTQGIIPNSPSNSQHISLRTTNEISKWMTSEVSLNYRRRHCDNIPVSSGYGATSIMYSLWCYAPNIDMDWVKNYWMPGMEGQQQDASLSGGKNNAYFIANESLNKQNRDRVYGNIKLDFTLYKGLTLMVRGGLDSNYDFRTQQTATSTQADPNGYFREQVIRSMQYSGEFLFRYTHDFVHDINLTANFGGSILNRQYEKHEQWADNLKNPGVYTLANAASQVKSSNYAYNRQTNSLYGLIQLSWRNAIFLDVTGRNDWSSTLPASNRSYFYPSVSGSVVLNELFDFGRTNGIVNMLKIRGSWAQVGHDTSPYRIEEYLSSTLFPGNVTTQTSKVNGLLKPEMVSSWEVGLDLRMFHNRFNLDVAYYNSKTTNALASMPVSAAAGMTRVYTNAGSILNQGVEVSAMGTLIRTKDIRWTVNANWSMNRNKILALGEGIDYWQIAQYSSYAYMYAYVGSSLTSMYGRPYKRAPKGSYAVDASGKIIDVSGQIVHDVNGAPVTDEEIDYIGECMPDWRGGFGTSFSWKGLKAAIKFDGQFGGKVWSLTNWVLNYRGKGVATLEGREGGFTPTGVIELPDGNYKICDVEHTASSIQTYYQAKYERGCAEANFVSTSFLKLREVRLEYSFPKKMLAKTKAIQGLSVAVFGNNLYCWSKFPGFDPEAVSMRGSALSPGFDLLQMPGTATYGGSISITF